ncbi:MAG: hypothetical protein H6718_30370 [Polyangiaceae bacterium]|nr:hypothetical protein [Myxococcales bacterium]MCB9589759.1 hypothetical protein [Polyangiaceae bacterium]
MQPYQPPKDESHGLNVPAGADDIELARPKTVVNAAVLALCGSGVLSILLVLQMLANFRIRGIASVILYSLLLLGAGNLIVGLQLRRLVRWAAPASVIVSTLTALVSIAWGLTSLMGLVFSLLAPLSSLACCSACLLSFLARKDALVGASARERLRSGGFDLGT